MASKGEPSSVTDRITGASASSAADFNPGYSKRHSRITKENLFMILALWMQDFPVSRELTQIEDSEVSEAFQSKDGEIPEATKVESSTDSKPLCKKVGAVLVSPNDIVYATNCTRDGVHGIARLLIKHHDIPEGCKVFVSRKPCSFCTKLLVQSGKVKRVLYLPFEPEYHTYSQSDFEKETERVDTLFKASAIGQSVFAPKVEKLVVEGLKNKTPQKQKMDVKAKKDELVKKYYSENWMEKAMKFLPWPAFDKLMEAQVKEDFEDAMEWIARILVLPDEANTFDQLHGDVSADKIPCTPEQAVRLLEMAQFLAERSDDPKPGVGAIITNRQMEVQALGWNGFPLKALYGEFPRASKDDQVEADKKYPYVIHAEQNALLMRNDKNLEGGTLFVTKTPCDECVPLLEMQGIKTVILDAERETKSKESEAKKKANAKSLSYKMFSEKVEDGVFCCFQRDSKRRGKKRKLSCSEDQKTDQTSSS